MNPEYSWTEQELELLQNSYLRYYDIIRIVLTDYEGVSSHHINIKEKMYVCLDN